MTINKRSMQRILLVAVILAVSGAPGAMASTGYGTDYDFPGRGDDWYGRLLPDTRRDFSPTPVDTASDGDDFDTGYEILTDPFGFGPPLALTDDTQYEYLFRVGSRLCDILDCYGDGDCTDGLFCNGQEQCISYSCYGGSAPDCNDHDLCTADSCNESLNVCDNDPLDDPGEVQVLLGAKPDPMDTIATFSWTGIPAADSYNLYRGEQADLSDMGCFMAAIPGTSTDDDGAIPASDMFEYLVTAYGCGGESTLGADSGFVERSPNEWCP